MPVLLALLALFSGLGLSPVRADVPPPAWQPNYAGNHLVNYLNPQLQHAGGVMVATGGHKTDFHPGNSTVLIAANYNIEWCNENSTPNQLTVLGFTPCTTSIASYTVNNASGSITVTFTGSTPSGYAVGDLVLSQPTNPTLNTLYGSGVVTAVGASTITYNLLPINPYPATAAAVSSGGYITNSLIPMGYNGATSTQIAATVIPLVKQYALPGDLVDVRGPLINDTRNGACDINCAIGRVQFLYDAIVAAIPQNTDMMWETENPLLLSDPTTSGYVTYTLPYTSLAQASAAYSKINHDAVFAAIASRPPRALLWDNYQLVYTKIGNERVTSTWWNDILHEALPAQTREGAYAIQMVQGQLGGRGCQINTVWDPYVSTGSNSGLLNGGSSQIQGYRQDVCFSQALEDSAMADNYAAPWTIYPDAVLDQDKYDVIAYGTICGGAASNSIRFTGPSVNGGVLAEAAVGDLIWVEGAGVFQIPSGFGQTPLNCGGPVYGMNLFGLGTIPATVYAGQRVAIMRQHSYSQSDIGYYADAKTYTYRHRVFISASGTNFLRITFFDGYPSFPTGITTADSVVLPCGVIPLTGANFFASGANTQISVTGSFGACSGQTGWLFGTHAMENNSSLVETALGGSDDKTYLHAAFVGGGNGHTSKVIAQTTASVSATPKTIATTPADGANLTVCGSDGTNAFCDQITGFLASAPTVLTPSGGGVAAGSPTARTYTVIGTGGTIQLAMASGTYNVSAFGSVAGQR